MPEYELYWRISAIKFGKRIMRNYNTLIDRYPGADGMKTGFICASGFNLVASATRNGKRLIAVVLGAPSGPVRAVKAAQLLERGFNSARLFVADAFARHRRYAAADRRRRRRTCATRCAASIASARPPRARTTTSRSRCRTVPGLDPSSAQAFMLSQPARAERQAVGADRRPDAVDGADRGVCRRDQGKASDTQVASGRRPSRRARSRDAKKPTTHESDGSNPRTAPQWPHRPAPMSNPATAAQGPTQVNGVNVSAPAFAAEPAAIIRRPRHSRRSARRSAEAGLRRHRSRVRQRRQRPSPPPSPRKPTTKPAQRRRRKPTAKPRQPRPAPRRRSRRRSDARRRQPTRGPLAPLPLTLLTGFLGAGKTTLLNRLLRDPALADTAVVINEFGDIALDHLLVEKIEGDTILLKSGCLCCNLRGDLVDALEKLLRDLDNGRARFKRVVLETTGLADPAPVLQTAMSHPYLVMRYRLDGVVTLVDAVNGSATLDAHPESVKQAAVADRIVLTKTDLLDTPEWRAAQGSPDRAAATRSIRRRRCSMPRAGEASADSLLELRAVRSRAQDRRCRALAGR